MEIILEILLPLLAILASVIGALIWLSKKQSKQNTILINEIIKQKNKGHCCEVNGCFVRKLKLLDKRYVIKEKNNEKNNTTN